MRRNKERKNGRREGKGRLNIWLEKGSLAQLRTEARSRSSSMQRIVETCLAERFCPKSQEDQMSLILRRLNLLDGRMQVLERLAEVQAELVAILARLYFASTPEMPETQRDAAWRDSQVQYDRFLASIAKRLKDNHTVLTELPGGILLRGRDYEKLR
jgi:hypothetical protein